MAVYDVRSISQVGTSEPFELQIARGQIPGHSFVHKIGEVPAMSQGQTGTVWDVNDTDYPWSAFDTAGTLTVDRASASDADKDVIISGLDADYNPLTETVTLTDATGNATTNSFKRVFEISMNGTSVNVGNVTIKKGATTVGLILAGIGQSLMGIYTIPAGFTGYITQGVMTVQEGADATGKFYVRQFGDRFRIGHCFEVTGGGEYHYAFTVPYRAPEKTDIDVRSTVRSNNARVTAAFDIILIKEQGPL